MKSESKPLGMLTILMKKKISKFEAEYILTLSCSVPVSQRYLDTGVSLQTQTPVIRTMTCRQADTQEHVP